MNLREWKCATAPVGPTNRSLELRYTERVMLTLLITLTLTRMLITKGKYIVTDLNYEKHASNHGTSGVLGLRYVMLPHVTGRCVMLMLMMLLLLQQVTCWGYAVGG